MDIHYFLTYERGHPAFGHESLFSAGISLSWY